MTFRPVRQRGYLEALAESAFDGQGRERVQAAVVIASGGQWDRFRSMLRLLELDWRDVLMAGGLGQDDWRAVLDAELGPTDDAAAHLNAADAHVLWSLVVSLGTVVGPFRWLYGS